jgi:hypothetical protein
MIHMAGFDSGFKIRRISFPRAEGGRNGIYPVIPGKIPGSESCFIPFLGDPEGAKFVTEALYSKPFLTITLS